MKKILASLIGALILSFSVVYGYSVEFEDSAALEKTEFLEIILEEIDYIVDYFVYYLENFWFFEAEQEREFTEKIIKEGIAEALILREEFDLETWQFFVLEYAISVFFDAFTQIKSFDDFEISESVININFERSFIKIRFSREFINQWANFENEGGEIVLRHPRGFSIFIDALEISEAMGESDEITLLVSFADFDEMEFIFDFIYVIFFDLFYDLIEFKTGEYPDFNNFEEFELFKEISDSFPVGVFAFVNWFELWNYERYESLRDKLIEKLYYYDYDDGDSVHWILFSCFKIDGVIIDAPLNMRFVLDGALTPFESAWDEIVEILDISKFEISERNKIIINGFSYDEEFLITRFLRAFLFVFNTENGEWLDVIENNLELRRLENEISFILPLGLFIIKDAWQFEFY